MTKAIGAIERPACKIQRGQRLAPRAASVHLASSKRGQDDGHDRD
jgi:hypothetical protein